MEQISINALTRTLTGVPSRRDVLRSLAGAGLGLGALRLSDVEAAKGKHKKKKGKKRHQKKSQPQTKTPQTQPIPPLVFNQFGCIEVGQPCRGDSTLCCSGISEGAAPAEGQPDTSRCVAHNAGVCSVDTDSCELGVEVRCDPSVPLSVCTITTGNAGFCADVSAGAPTHCRVCTKDPDCQGEFGPGAACVVFGGDCTPLCIATGRTACLPAAGS